MLEEILFYVFLVDAISANLLVMLGSKWYSRHLRVFSRWFPPARGWAIYYLVLILWIGSLLYRAGILF